MKLISLVVFLAVLSSAQNYWQQTSGPLGGSVTSVSLNSVSSDLYLTMFGSGVYKSTNDGNSWINIKSDYASRFAKFIETNSLGDLFFYDGSNFFRSTDNGATWILINPNSFFRIEKISIKNSTILLYDDIKDSLFYSSNSGYSWKIISSRPLTQFPNVLLVSKNGDFYLANYQGFFKSSDTANTWDRIYITTNNPTIIALAEDDSGGIYAATENNELFLSTNGGTTWLSKNLPATIGYIKEIKIFGASRIYLRTFENSLVFSSNSGVSWATIGTAFINKKINTINFDASGNLLVGTVGSGFYFSSNNGISWNASNQGLKASTIRSIFAASDNFILAGTYGNGVWLTSDFGESWQLLNDFSFSPITQITSDKQGNLYLSTENAGVFRSIDSGNSWQAMNNGLPNLNIYSIEAVGSELLLAGGMQKIFYSTNNGNSWNQSNSPSAFYIDFLDVENDGFYAATSQGILKSTDLGLNWIVIYPNAQVTCLKNFGNKIFASTSFKGLLYSSNSGQSWSSVNSWLHSFEISSIAINEIEEIYLGIYGARVFRSTDYGISWTILHQGMEPQDIISIALSPNGLLYAGTVGHGLFRSVHSTTGLNDRWADMATTYSLFQNYPNPFNPNTMISFQLSAFSNVVLKIFDVLGNEVATLVNEEKEPGVYNYQFSILNYQLPSGVYFYQLRAGDYVETKKMILLR